MADEKRDSRVLENLYEFLEGDTEDVGSLPIDRVLKDLKREGIDASPLVDLVREKLAAARAAELLAQAREERGRIQQLALQTTLDRTMPSLRERARRGLEVLSAKKPDLAAAYWRKFETASEADLESVLDDLALLNRLEGQDGDDR